MGRHDIDLMDPSVGNRFMADGAADGLTPLEPLDVMKIRDFDEMLQAMSKTAFGGRNVGEAAEARTLLAGLGDAFRQAAASPAAAAPALAARPTAPAAAPAPTATPFAAAGAGRQSFSAIA